MRTRAADPSGVLSPNSDTVPTDMEGRDKLPMLIESPPPPPRTLGLDLTDPCGVVVAPTKRFSSDCNSLDRRDPVIDPHDADAKE